MSQPARSTDVLIVSLGATAGLREADQEFAGSLRRCGTSTAIVYADRVKEWRTYALIEFAWALSARRAALAGIAAYRPRSIIYSSTTAAMLRPVNGAIRFDSCAADNRPGRHGLWQRPLERRRFTSAPLLLPWSENALKAAPLGRQEDSALVIPVPVEPSGTNDGPSSSNREHPKPNLDSPITDANTRDITAITYAANPHKKGLDRILTAWRAARQEDETLMIAGIDGEGEPGIHYAGMLPRVDYRSLLRRSRIFLTAPRREDYGVAQLEALADGCQLVTTPSPGPYAALPLAQELDPRLVTQDIGEAIRVALDYPISGYAKAALEKLAPWRTKAIDHLVAEELIPRLAEVGLNTSST